MNEMNRVFGNNVKLFIHNKKLDEQVIAKNLSYSKYDLWKIMDGRLFLDDDEKRDIAKELQTTVEDLYIPRSEMEYHAAGCMECRGEFSSADNKKRILDLLDVYCDIQELIAEGQVIFINDLFFLQGGKNGQCNCMDNTGIY